MKILLVVKSKIMENLGAMYLSSVIKQAGHECRIAALDSNDLNHDAWNIACNWIPDIVGYSIMTGDRERFRLFNERIVDMLNGCGWMDDKGGYGKHKFKIIVGGPDPTFFPEGYDWADYVFKGEAEQQIVDVFFHSGGPYPNINSLPWPDRTDFPNMRVRDFIASRGCFYSCNYCYNARWAELFPEQKGVRTRSVDDVIAEIRSVDPEYVYFQDSCFGVDKKWFEKFAEEYARHISIPYQCNFRPEQITFERAKMLAKSNCVAVRMAVESASERLRKLVGRHMSLGTVMDAMGMLDKWGIQIMLQNIIGLPTATIEDDLETLMFNIAAEPTYAWVSIYQPYPGTVLGDKCKAKGWYKGDYSDITDSFFETSHLEISPEYREQLEVLQKVFALCVNKRYLPKPEELTHENFPSLVHKIMRKDGDRKLYLGVL